MDKQVVIYSYNGILLRNKRDKFLIHTAIWINL